MYYLQSRYYNPEIGRFISRDDVQYHEGDTGVKANLYAYCDNNPVMNSDPNGHWIIRAIVAAVSGAVFGTIAYLIGRALKLNKQALRVFTLSFIVVGIVIGVIWGPSILYRINSLIKPVIYFFSNPGKVYFGIKLLGRIQFELHNPHHGKGIHFVIRIMKDGRLRQVWEYIFRR